MLKFRVWLENTAEVQVAHFLEDIIDKAVNLFKQSGNPTNILDYIRQVWPPEAKKTRLTFPATLPQGVAGKVVDFKRLDDQNRATCWHKDGQFIGFTVNIEPFFKAKSIEEIDQYAESLKSAIHHECEHISNPGSHYQGNDVHQAMQYMGDDGEIRGHAREMARAYAKQFPNEPFDLTKAQTLLDMPNFNNTHKNYFRQLADPNIAKKHGLQKNPHDDIIRIVQEMLPQYQGI